MVPGLRRLLGVTVAVVVLLMGDAEAGSASGWSQLYVPGHGALAGVSCTSTKACMAVGYDFAGPAAVLEPVVELWNGSSWAMQSPATLRELRGAFLHAVSCSSPAHCTAVGSTECGQLIARWNGARWSIQPNPRVFRRCAGVNDSPDLMGVSCPSRKFCVAVGAMESPSGGSSGNGLDQAPLIERWDGAKWSVQIAGDPLSYGGPISAVSCTAKRFCLAVGAQSWRWNGTKWLSAELPGPDEAFYEGGVSCTSQPVCMAVGDDSTTDLVAAQWNGRRWSIRHLPTGLDSYPDLYSVSCTSSTACTAVGDHNVGNGVWQALAEHWDGRSWKIQLNSAPAGSSLDSVSCVSVNACMAVGNISNGQPPVVPLAETTIRRPG